MKFVIAVIVAITLGGCSADKFASDIPQSGVEARGCMWSDAVLDVDDFLLEHRSVTAEIYHIYMESGEDAAKKAFLYELYSTAVDDDCARKTWEWMVTAHLKFESPTRELSGG